MHIFTGKPDSYAEYFSLNRTTAELLLLKPIDRELYRRFDLVIKVRNSRAANRGVPYRNSDIPLEHFFLLPLNPKYPSPLYV